MINETRADWKSAQLDYANAQYQIKKEEEEEQIDAEKLAAAIPDTGSLAIPGWVPKFYSEPSSPGDLDGAGGALTSSPASIHGDPIEPESKNSILFYTQNQHLLVV